MVIEERDYTFDNIKAFLIASTVFAHLLKQSPTFTLNSPCGYIYFIIFSFIMEGFFLISGYFSGNTVKCRNTAVKNFLLPYIFFTLLVSGISLLICGRPRGDLIVTSFALWFMLAMFVFRVTVDLASKFKYILPAAFLLYFLAGCLPLDNTLAGARICHFFLFYIIGYKMKPRHFEKIRSIRKVYTVILGVLLAAASVAIVRLRLFPMGMLYMRDSYESRGLTFPEGWLISLVILILFFGWFAVIVNLMPAGKTFFSDIGRKTITIYLLHIGVRYLFMYTPAAGPGGITSFLIALLTTIVILWLFSREPVYKAYNLLVDLMYKPIELLTCWKR